MESLEQLRYPIGRMPNPTAFSQEEVQSWIADIEKLPRQLRDAVQNMTPEQLNTPYRSGGWTVRQVVHHVADSHMNAIIRLKLGLTEDNPTIKPYEEQLWAELPDYKLDIEVSLQLIERLHQRFVAILRGMSWTEFSRTVFHPGLNDSIKLGGLTNMYSWHGRHHTAHIINLKTQMGW
ncbi:MAG: putative metal-dependent hydrolase [Saprospiraceae bacterium]|nr:putative metal-dependent hydrolase [Saprospiraceae bacterium]